MEKRRDKLAEIARTFDLEIMYAFGSHAENALNWLEDEQPSLLILSPSDLDIGVKPSSKRSVIR